MATRYEPDKIIQLLQLNCWKERTEMTQGGLIELSARLGLVSGNSNHSREKDAQPNERYFVDLLSDARRNLKEGRPVNKTEAYIAILLHNAGFHTWEEWTDALRKPAAFFRFEDEPAINQYESEVTVFIPSQLSKLHPVLAFAGKSFPLEVLSSGEENLRQLALQALAQRERSYAVICAIPMSWKDQVQKMRDPAWGELRKSGRILPVWVDEQNEWKTAPPFVSLPAEEHAAAGLAGILTGLLCLQERSVSQSVSETEAPKSGSEKASVISNSSIGFYMNGGTVHHLNTGGDQTIHNYFGRDEN